MDRSGRPQRKFCNLRKILEFVDSTRGVGSKTWSLRDPTQKDEGIRVRTGDRSFGWGMTKSIHEQRSHLVSLGVKNEDPKPFAFSGEDKALIRPWHLLTVKLKGYPSRDPGRVQTKSPIFSRSYGRRHYSGSSATEKPPSLLADDDDDDDDHRGNVHSPKQNLLQRLQM